jgi:hypothetical protein
MKIALYNEFLGETEYLEFPNATEDTIHKLVTDYIMESIGYRMEEDFDDFDKDEDFEVVS